MSELKEEAIVGDAAGKSQAPSKDDEKLKEMPPEVCALRLLQLETKEIQFEFFKRIYELEIEFHKKHDLIYKKRRDIVNGIPPASAEENNDGSSVTGIPKFWSNVLSSALFEVQSEDRPILEHLTDVRATSKPFAELGFVLEFDFSPNEYFENETLTKEYFYTCKLGNELVHQGPQICKSVGCDIKWKEGKTVGKDSFFNFFRSRSPSDEETSGSDEMYGMSNDFEMGYFIKERIIPRAVLLWNDTPLPPTGSCSIEHMSPATSSIFPDVGSSDRNKSTSTSTIGDLPSINESE